MDIGKLVKSLRLRKGLTQEELADKTDISVRTIQRIENGEVDPRAYTLQAIASALDVEYDIFSQTLDAVPVAQDPKWIALLHLSGLFVLILPPLIIWIWKKDSIEGLNEHGRDVINFQLSISLYALPFLLASAYPIFILIAVYSQVVIILNTVRVIKKQKYKYPLNIRFIH